MTAVVAALFAIALALAAVSLLVPVADRLRIPHTVLLAVLGMVLGLAASRFDLAAGASPMGDAFDGLRALVLSPEAFLYIFLPPLLFTAGLMIDVRRLFDEISAVLLLAIVAVLVCIGVVGGLVHVTTGVDIYVCLLLGAIVSTTDPAAVIGILRDVGAPKRLSILAEGEALFNDAAAITVFVILIDILAGRALGSVASPAFIFLREFLGGLALGFVLAHGALMILSRLGGSSVAVVSVTVSLAYLAYILGDKYIHVSGVVAVVAAALTLAAVGPTRLQPRQWEALQHSWHQLEFWASSMIFLLASMVAVTLLAGVTKSHILGLAALYFAAFGARALVLFGLLPALEALGRVQPVDHRYKTMIVWGGLRGAVTLALALVAYANPRLPQEARDFVAILATLFVIATLFVNAPSLRPLMRFFRLNELDETDAALRERVLRLSRATVADQVHEVADDYGVESDVARCVPHLEEALGAAGGDVALPADKRLAYALRTLCARERELYLEQFEHQTISRRMVGLLVAGAERVQDRVRTEGAPGYALALREVAEYGRGFRTALWIHATFGWEAPLTARLADRFEALLVVRVVLRELVAFNRDEVAGLLGAATRDEAGAALEQRRDGVERALRALSLQYAGYAEAVRLQHLQRAAYRLEAAEYDRQWRNSAINHEVHADLQRALDGRRAASARRPPLRLGMELTAMIGRVPLFAGLAPAEVRAVGRRLRARMALPGELIVARGGKGDAMYFIAAGAAKVRLVVGEVVLKEGDFFGEKALLDGKPRNADVVAEGVCHLLVLDAREFHRLLDSRPSMRAEIEAVAAPRQG